MRLALLACVLSACSANLPLPTASQLASAPAATRAGDLGAYFDAPPEFPGYPWTYQGRPVDTTHAMNTIAAAGHCGWQAATLMHLPLKLGATTTSSAEMRQFVRDAKRVTPQAHLHGTLDLNATLPADATATGYRFQVIEIYLSPSDTDSVFLVAPTAVERWPRSDPMTLCS